MLKLFKTWPYYLSVSPLLYTLSVYICCSCPSLYIVLYTISVYAHCLFLSVLVHCPFLYTISVYTHCLFLSVLVHCPCTIYPFMRTVCSCPFLYTISVYAHCMFLSVLDIVLTCTFYVFEPCSVSDALYINLFYLYLQSI